MRLFALFGLVALALATAVLTGCSGNAPANTTTSTVSTAPSNTASSTTEPSTPQLTQWQKELAKTSQIENQLVSALLAEQAPDNDPRRGIVAGLKARDLAISCRQALQDNDLQTADSTMLQLYHTLNMSREVATGTVAQTIESARTIIDSIGAPSDAPDKAAPLLEQFITATAPLLDAATAATPSTTTTT
jgi:hypothetical protein